MDGNFTHIMQVEILFIQKVDGWAKCIICNNGPFKTTYETDWIHNCFERKYCKQMCHGCLKTLVKLDHEIQNDEASLRIRNIVIKYRLL